MKKKHLVAILINTCFIIGIYFLISSQLTPVYLPTEEALMECFSSDTKTTLAPQIQSNILTSWHSSLFLLEGQMVNQLILYFCGTKISAILIIWMLFMFWTHAAVIALAYMQHSLITRHWIFTILPIIDLFAIYKLITTPMVLGLDCVFTCCFICLMGLAYGIFQKDLSRWKKYVLSFLLLIIILHMIQYRKQALLIIPFFIYPVLPFLTSVFKSSSLRSKFIAAAVISGVMFCIAHPLFNTIFRVATNAPIQPMLYSDIRIACELRNKQEEYIQEYNPKNSIVGTLYPGFWFPEYRNKDVSVSKLYLSNLWKHPKEMLSAKCLQMVTFYTGGYLPNWVIKSIEYMYPVVKQNEKAWILPPESITCMLPNRVSAYTRLLLIICAGCIWLHLVRKQYKNHHKCTPIDAFVTIGCSCSFVYAISFCIITPTWDARFLAPSEILSIIFLSIWALSFIHDFLSSKSPLKT